VLSLSVTFVCLLLKGQSDAGILAAAQAPQRLRRIAQPENAYFLAFACKTPHNRRQAQSSANR